MEYISSDTNVWVDFATINQLSLPFLLPYIFLMNEDAVENELLSPKGLKKQLLDFGLVSVELTEEEFYLAEEYNHKYVRPSLYDCVALAIAKVRGITLMSGDGPLRKAAEQEDVRVIGTIGILDELYCGEYIDAQQYTYCLTEFKKHNGQKVRLPEKEIQRRLERL